LSATACAAAFESLPLPAYLVDDAGALVGANALGRRAARGSPLPSGALAASVTPALRVVVVTTAPDREGLLAGAGVRWHLTPREQEVVNHLVRGLSNKEIADRTGCREGTVEAHLVHVCRKAGVSGCRELLARFWGSADGAPRKGFLYGSADRPGLEFSVAVAPPSSARPEGVAR
jgi:DNA-binding CsgD family transcriptional regulator